MKHRSNYLFYFIFNDQISNFFRHVLFGSAFGLTNTVVPFPSLSNLLFNMNADPRIELRDASKLYWLKFKQHLQSITRTLNGFDSLLSNA